MRKIFSQRARVVVYLENEAVDRMVAKAREEGKTLVEWARETLVEGLEDNSDLPRSRGVRMARRGPGAVESPKLPCGGSVGVESGLREPKAPAPGGRTCKHGIAKGYRCWQCGGMAVIGGPDA